MGAFARIAAPGCVACCVGALLGLAPLGAQAQVAPPAVYGAALPDDAEAVFDAPAPPTLPALTRRDLTFTFEYTAASIDPERTTGASGQRAYAWFSHSELELPVVPRKWFIGAAHDIAAASVPGVGTSVFLGSPEIWGRGVWSSVRGLSSGGGFGVVVPFPRELSVPQQKVLKTARVVRPWDEAYFSDFALVLRPWFDMRHITGPFIFQFRQGIDWSIVLRKPEGGEHVADIRARAAFYFGYRASKAAGLGLELWEVYQLTEGLADDQRGTFAISPSIRFILPRVQPALSVLLPIATALRGDVDSYYAARLNVAFTFPTGRSSAD